MSASLQTKVRNTHTTSLYYSYLGSHGVRLAAGAEHTEDGDLVSKINSGRAAKRRLTALNADLAADRIAIVSTPKDHFYDEEADETKILRVHSGAITAIDPSWGAYSSSLVPYEY